jgi:type VI secretion system secreted protein VgrG
MACGRKVRSGVSQQGRNAGQAQRRTSAHIPLKTLIGRQASLVASLSDGTRTRFTGLIQQAAQLGSEGGLARYRLRIVPWLWMLGQVRNSRVWQDHSVQDIIDSVLAAYPQHAAWAWSSDATAHLADAPLRSYCIQYRESDLAFVERLLAEEGLTWRVTEAPDAIKGHQIVFIADTTQTSACPQDPSSAHALGGAGIRFHASGSREEQDSIQALVAQRSLHASLVSLLSFDYKAKQSITTSVPTTQRFGSKNAPALEAYDTPGLYAWPNAQQATRYATQHMQAIEASSQTWLGHSTVRTLRPGTQFTLTQGPLKTQPSAYTLLRVASLGINNLPKPAQQSVAELFGALPELLQASLQELLEPQAAATGKLDAKSASSPHGTCASSYQFHSELFSPATITKATTLGYANTFEALDAAAPWRPILPDGTGSRAHPRATAWGSQSAIVVDANGSPQPSGADEIYCDKLGRVRIQFHWQAQSAGQGGAANATTNTNASCWVRVAQRAAGAGRGLQFLPRIGQEVLVQFLEGDIDRPIILGALYNGQGEGGVAPTPAGQANGNSSAISTADNPFAAATDHQSSAQGNLLGAAGAAPAWHGASADTEGQRNAAAQWGIRSKEFGASALGASAGYNQLLLDDSTVQANGQQTSQGRIQLKTTQAATELNLGHLIHSADNYRGSLRGTGAELRTDAYGAVRAGAGLLITSYSLQHNPANRDPAGDNAPGMALLKQASTLANTFSQAAATHQTVALASAQGSTAANASVLDGDAKQHAPIKALHTAASGMVSSQTISAAQSDAADKHTSAASTGTASTSTIPHSTDPILSISAQGGLAAVAGQSLQLANGETISLMSGQNSQYTSGGQMRIHTGQAIGMLGGVVKPGDANTGVQLIAAQDKIDIQAQASTLKVQAKDAITIQSASGNIDWAAAKKISISTAGGANITIEGGNITVQCPGKLTVHASVKNFEGPGRVDFQMPVMPRSVCAPCLLSAAAGASPFAAKA